MWSENPSQWTTLEPLCYAMLAKAILVHGVIGYKFCWLLPEDQNQGTPAGHESAETPIGNESLHVLISGYLVEVLLQALV